MQAVRLMFLTYDNTYPDVNEMAYVHQTTYQCA